ncbi:MAG: alpha-D-ribose 1-methylphosphonate 5-triphosphate diphosphatase [Rhizobiales bacterium]|nr:alpha-D-ribose 1-methylphosphonate 5-triphosphate diphosphatase [Hyphomicrobiales bacterium]
MLRGGKVLLADGDLAQVDIIVEDGLIADIGHGMRAPGARPIDATGCLVLPGIVDIHGDAFERNIMPRPGTMLPLGLAMLESDRQLASNGITTAYHGVTVSWEPGLRCVQQSLSVVAALDEIKDQALIDNRIHIRWENYAIDELPAVYGLMDAAKKPLLAFNDHTTPGIAGERKPSKYRASAEKAMISVDDYLELLRQRAARSAEVAPATEAVAIHAANKGITMLSHDDSSVAMRSAYRKMGVTVAEFPMNWETVEDAVAAGDWVVLGAPNVVRGGSHNGSISAEEAIGRRQCQILASDYYYPALLQAALMLVERGTSTISEAWQLISMNPARAAGLHDRGAISPGHRADLVVLPDGRTRAAMVICGGRVVYGEG